MHKPTIHHAPCSASRLGAACQRAGEYLDHARRPASAVNRATPSTKKGPAMTTYLDLKAVHCWIGLMPFTRKVRKNMKLTGMSTMGNSRLSRLPRCQNTVGTHIQNSICHA